MSRCLPYGEFKWLKNVENSHVIQSATRVQYDINSNRNEVIRTVLNSNEVIQTKLIFYFLSLRLMFCQALAVNVRTRILN